MNDEIKALREEISKLRERIAVLEARDAYPTQPAPMFVPSVSPGTVPNLPPRWWEVTCYTGGAPS